MEESKHFGNQGEANLPQFLRTIRNAYEKYHLHSLKRPLEVCENLLTVNPQIDVAVLGQFKSGKSSFLNSLVDKTILPVGVLPVTTVITRLQYGSKERAIITHFDGTTEEIDCSRIEEFTSELKNPGNQKNVEQVDIELPSLAKYPGIRLVDTPGLGSVFQYHQKTSENWIPETGTAILAISADRPLSENDLALIRELSQYTPHIILLLTKVDLLSSDQQNEVINFFRATLKRELDREFPIYLYSTRFNLERWKQIVETELLVPLVHNREIEYRRILNHKLRTLIKSSLNYLDIALKSALQLDANREELRKLILDEKLNFDLMREELIMISYENAGQTRPFILKRLEELYRPRLTQLLITELREEMPKWKGSLWRLTRNYEQWLEESLTEKIEQISKTEHQHFLGTLKKAYVSFSRYLESFRSLLNNNLERALGLKLTETEWKIEVEEPKQPDIKTSRTFDFNIDLIWFLIPMIIFRPLFEKHFIRQIPREVEVNLARLASKWAERINKVIEKMRYQAEKYIKDELATIESLLVNAGGQTDEIQKTMEELQNLLKRLEG
jgi:GTP-binding protein EngB required for normal cell division